MDAGCSRIRFGVGVRTSLKQITQNFPIVSCLSRSAHRAIEALQSSLTVDHGSAFLGKTERGQNGGRGWGCVGSQNVHENESWQCLELRNGESELNRIFAESEQGFDLAGGH